MGTSLRERLEALETIRIDPAYLDELEQMGALPECEMSPADVTTKRLLVDLPKNPP